MTTTGATTTTSGPGRARAVQRDVAARLHEVVGSEVRSAVDLILAEVVGDLSRDRPDCGVTVDVDRFGPSVTVTITADASSDDGDAVAGLLPVHARAVALLELLCSAWGRAGASTSGSLWFTVLEANSRSRPHPIAPAVATASGTLEYDVGTSLAPGPPILTAARSAEAEVEVAVIAEAAAIAAVTIAEHDVEPGVLSLRAALIAAHAATAAARKASDAATTARSMRSTAANIAAADIAALAASAVEAVQVQADELAVAAAAAASAAARTVAHSVTPDGDTQAGVAALQLAATVAAAAAAKVEETASAAVLVARAVAEAAAAVALATASAAADTEHEVLDAAAELRAVTTATARQLAADTAEREAALARAAQTAAEASERLKEANLRLRQAGLHDRIVARALQAAMLSRLPEPPNLQLAARYRTAAQDDQVGGDWYDAVVLAGSTSLVIGDVVGHDILAAAVMGQLRNLLRALLWDRNDPPSGVLNRLDRAVRDLHIDTMATVVLMDLAPPPPDRPDAVATVRWSNAGHPAPIIVEVDGTAALLDDRTDILLGVRPDVVRHDHSHVVTAGATVLLYTDGLIETRDHDLDTGLQRLLDTVGRHHRLPPGDFLDAVLTDMVGDQPADDAAVLAVRFSPTLGLEPPPAPVSIF